jgi:hypothetical protein
VHDASERDFYISVACTLTSHPFGRCSVSPRDLGCHVSRLASK